MALAAQPVTEFNVVRLGLISFQTRLPASVATSPRMGATPGLVPHGLDGDIFAALVTEAVIACESGLQDHQSLRVRAWQLWFPGVAQS